MLYFMFYRQAEQRKENFLVVPLCMDVYSDLRKGQKMCTYKESTLTVTLRFAWNSRGLKLALL